MKKILLIFTFISLAYVGVGQNHFIESFENPDSWSGYTTGTVNFDSGNWDFVQVYPESSGDSYDGSKACRINDDEAGASIASPSVNGVGTVSFYYHRPFSGSGSFELQKSVNGGAYTTLATVDYSSVTTPTEYTYDVDDASNNIKIRIVNDENTAHLTIDYFTMGEAGVAPDPEPTNHVTSFTATANGHDQIDLSWTDAVEGTQAPDGYFIKGSDEDTLTNPSDGYYPTEDSDLSDGFAMVRVGHGAKGSTSFSGLSEETTYYFQIWSYTNSGDDVNYKTDGPTDNATTGAAPSLPNAWINEIHYDNVGTDINEMIEIVIENAGSHTLADFEVTLYNGNGGSEYGTETIDNFSSDDSEGNYTFYTWLPSSIQNGGPDGLALSYGGTLIQFLSYEGSFTATDGVANGETSLDIGVEETGSTLSTESLQLTGIGTEYSDFTWQTPATATDGSLNSEQYFEVDVTWDSGASTTSWNDANNWSNDEVPNHGSNVTIGSGKADIEIAADATAECNNLTVEGTLTVKSDNTGTGSLIVNGTATGNVTVERYLTDGAWHLVSPSTTGVTVDDFHFNGSPDSWLTYHTESTGAYEYYTDLNQSLNVGQGYSVWLDGSKAAATASMAGEIQTGDLNASLDYSGTGDSQSWNLIGNPFTSALDWEEFTNYTNTSGSVYIWTGSESYHTHNGTVGTPVSFDGIIPISQGFFVKASADANFTIQKDARTHSSQSFYKNESNESKPYVWLSLGFESYTESIAIGFPENGSSSFDAPGDAHKLFADEDTPQLFAVEDEVELAINTRSSLNNQNQQSVPVNIAHVQDGDYTLSIEKTDYFEDVTIELEDLKTGEMHEFKNENSIYEFTAAESDDEERFLLHFNKATIGIEESPELEGVNVYTSSKYINIKTSSNLSDGKATIVNALGQVIHAETLTNEHQTFGINESGVYIVRITSDEGTLTKKVVIE